MHIQGLSHNMYERIVAEYSVRVQNQQSFPDGANSSSASLLSNWQTTTFIDVAVYPSSRIHRPRIRDIFAT